MNIDPNAIVSMAEANRDFSRVAQLAEKYGQAVIFKKRPPQVFAGGHRRISASCYDGRRKDRRCRGADSEKIQAGISGAGEIRCKSARALHISGCDRAFSLLSYAVCSAGSSMTAFCVTGATMRLFASISAVSM